MSNDSRERDPSRHDGVTIPCPACGRAFTAVGRQRWCSGACRAVGYRRRKQTAAPPVALAAPTPLRPRTVYECDSCSTRSIAEPALRGLRCLHPPGRHRRMLPALRRACRRRRPRRARAGAAHMTTARTARHNWSARKPARPSLCIQTSPGGAV